MSEVNRYDLIGEYDLEMSLMNEGDYVEYSDYQLLEAKCQKLERQLEKCKEQRDGILNELVGHSLPFEVRKDELNKELENL